MNKLFACLSVGRLFDGTPSAPCVVALSSFSRIDDSWLDYNARTVCLRDKWLKDNGLMFPSHASMVWAPVDDRNEKLRRDNDYKE